MMTETGDWRLVSIYREPESKVRATDMEKKEQARFRDNILSISHDILEASLIYLLIP